MFGAAVTTSNMNVGTRCPFAKAGVGAVLFDEFHERNLMSDLALGLVKKLQRTGRTDLKIVVMSATIETGPIARYLGQADDDSCRVLASDGRTFPVEICFGQF